MWLIKTDVVVWCLITSEAADLRLKTFVVTKSNLWTDRWLYDQRCGWHSSAALMGNVHRLMNWPKHVTHFKYWREKKKIIWRFLFSFSSHSSSLDSIATRQENPSKCRMSDSFLAPVYKYGRVPHSSHSAAAQRPMCQYYGGRKPLFNLFSTNTHTHCDLKARVCSNNILTPCVTAFKRLWYMMVTDEKSIFSCFFFPIWPLQWPRYCQLCHCCQFVLLREHNTITWSINEGIDCQRRLCPFQYWDSLAPPPSM